MTVKIVKRSLGQTEVCCIDMGNSLRLGYVRKGYMFRRLGEWIWIPWSYNLSGEGWRDVSPISYCPFCGLALNEVE